MSYHDIYTQHDERTLLTAMAKRQRWAALRGYVQSIPQRQVWFNGAQPAQLREYALKLLSKAPDRPRRIR